MFLLLLGIAEAALSIWADKESRKYIDKLASIKRDYNAEYNKPLAERSDAVLDNLFFELRLTVNSLTADIGKQNTKA